MEGASKLIRFAATRQVALVEMELRAGANPLQRTLFRQETPSYGSFVGYYKRQRCAVHHTWPTDLPTECNPWTGLGCEMSALEVAERPFCCSIAQSQWRRESKDNAIQRMHKLGRCCGEYEIPVCKETLCRLQMSLVHSPESHYLFPSAFRRSVIWILLVIRHAMKARGCMGAYSGISSHVLSFLPRDFCICGSVLHTSL